MTVTLIKQEKNRKGVEKKLSYKDIRHLIDDPNLPDSSEIYQYEEEDAEEVCCIICETKSLKNTLDNNGCVYDHAIITKQILESAKHLPDKEVIRTFEFHWFEHAVPINEPVALSDSEVDQLLSLSRGTQELIFSILGYSVLALIAPDMSENNKIKAIHIAERANVKLLTGDECDTKPNAKSKKKQKNQSTISPVIVDALKEITSACFVSAGGCDLPHTMYVDVKTSDRAVSELCERRLVFLDTTTLREDTDKDQKKYREILGEYLQYADQFEPKKFPTHWLPLVIAKEYYDDRFYCLKFKETDMYGVTDVTPVLHKLYRNALVGTSSGDFSKLREQVVAWADEIETKSNADGMKRTYIERMTDYLFACCRYTAAGNEALIKDIHSALYSKRGDKSNESLPDNDENPETESTPQITENCAKVIDAIFALVKEQKITEERNADNPDMAAFIYYRPKTNTRCVCFGEKYISELITNLDIQNYTCEFFIQDCANEKLLEISGQKGLKLGVRYNGPTIKFYAIKFPEDFK